LSINYKGESSIEIDMNQPLLHVMIPVYGDSPYLEETLNSVVKHLPTDLPVTVVEDPSNSQELAKTLNKFKERIKHVVNSERLGVAGNFNKCAQLSSGIYTQIIGSDDIFLNSPVPLITRLIDGKDAPTILIPKAKVISNKKIFNLTDLFKAIVKPKVVMDRKVLSSQFARSTLIGDWPYFPAIIWKTEYLTLNPFSEKFESAMDLDLFVRMIGTDFTVIYLNNYTISYRRHEASQSTKLSLNGNRFIEELACHSKAVDIARSKGLIIEEFLAKIALSVRLHAFWKAISLIHRNPGLSMKMIKISLKSIK
jgi:glycosyltransferase involved in cell wall biosynthesis